ncbi:hypothetical protein N9N28_03695 [Rubripirellula amarantea]|uniref:Uncharacterized protein n=1 Tax=Rubripirellula amarantea TaxID=2527999 RepID=A0A5C5WVM0_9BACT|nr:hypothetical protein [Rubripirellula amarantea]MDA8743719.1 hypothetical protein [Rubripirellula amarantea]TWT54590.1 hypothetical protein Pla22_22400 [Rubripirellula amarantea]
MNFRALSFQTSGDVLASVLVGVMAIPLASGCGMNAATIDSIREVVEQSSTGDVSQSSNADSDSPLSVALSKLKGEADGRGANSGEDPEFTSTYSPPFPDRDNPFYYPSRGEEAEVNDATASVADIEVLGFASIHEPTVLLRTKSGVKSMKVGDRIDGVTVVSIREPVVELKLGTLVWTATMFDRGR